MQADTVFAAEEFRARLQAVRAEMAARDIDIALLSTPENIYYLTGLDHWGYFAPHLLIVPADGEMVLITRAMERVTIANQVRNARFEGHDDSETAADMAVRLLRDRSTKTALGAGAVEMVADAVPGEEPRTLAMGIESWSAGLPHGLALALKDALPHVAWCDVTGMVDRLRLVKSPAERDFMRMAARVSDAACAAAVETIRAGASEREVAAECHRAMIAAGGTFPGFGPFIRSTARLGEEHTSWTDARIADGDAVFLELAGCVNRYHAPLGRLVHIGHAPDEACRMAEVCRRAFDAVLGALRPGARAREVYAAWQGVVDGAGLSHYRRHHCGYAVGIGFPPSWTGGNTVTGLRHDSELEILEGMTFHILSWLMGTGGGDYFLSNTVLVDGAGPEVLTHAPMGVTVR